MKGFQYLDAFEDLMENPNVPDRNRFFLSAMYARFQEGNEILVYLKGDPACFHLVRLLSVRENEVIALNHNHQLSYFLVDDIQCVLGYYSADELKKRSKCEVWTIVETENDND